MRRPFVPWVVLGIGLTLGVVGSNPALAAVGDDDLEQVRPESGSKIARIDRATESVTDGATIYLNDHDGGPFFIYGTSTGGRRPDWGERLSVVPNTPAPLEIRSIEFSISVSANTTLVTEFDIWDVYNTAASPVNSGLLRSEEGNFGTVAANPVGLFYRQIPFLFSSPIPLSDPSVFVEFKYKTTTGAGAPLNLAVRPVADTNVAGPQIGTSEDDVYTDQNADGIFTFSAPNAGDRRQTSSSACSPTNLCATNWNFHIRGAANPNVIDPGIDLFETPAGGASFFNNSWPRGFFDNDDFGDPCSPPGNYTSDVYSSGIVLKGLPVFNDGGLQPTDTILRRLATATLPSPGSSATIPVEIVAMSLVSQTPITVVYRSGGTTVSTQWDVSVCLSDEPQSQGSMTIVKGACANEGGTYTATVPVLPKITFTLRGTPPNPLCSGTITHDYGTLLLPAVVYAQTAGRWYSSAPPALGLIEDPAGGTNVDPNCDGVVEPLALPPTSSNFHAGVRAPRCPADATCNSVGDGIKRIDTFVAQTPDLSNLALLPAETSVADNDADGIPNLGDNCPNVANPLQQDSDGDYAGNSCDNCASICNPGQQNADGDAFGDACDCGPLDPTNSPPDIQSLNFTQPRPDKQTISWVANPPATSYDVVRGTLASFPVGPGGAPESCLGNNLAAATVTDGTTPATGTAGYFYVVRGDNSCGLGNYGKTHTNPGPALNGAARSTTTCP